MHVRIHHRNFEVWESAGEYRRTHAWRIQGRHIPPSVFLDTQPHLHAVLQEKVDRLIRGGYPIPPTTKKPEDDADRLLNDVTMMCSRARWGQLSPCAISQLVVAVVRLSKTIELLGASVPKRQRRVRSAFSTTAHTQISETT